MTSFATMIEAIPLFAMIRDGGWTMWLIAALSVVTLAVVLWKICSLWQLGVWGGRHSQRALELWTQGQQRQALAEVKGRPSARARVAQAAIGTTLDPSIDEKTAREETSRIARQTLFRAREGLRALELIATIAPLLGLLGTVLGMISAFQVLQEAGSRADPSALAGGIWEALLTTAAGMTVAIPAGVALSWLESVVDKLQADMEDLATRIFVKAPVADQPAARHLEAAE
ncbi:MotA/TolQ/ExbB proton channel family protein [Paracoccus seriniphilus]|uniref:Outer membrane transport energization protein ExbB n=1 Tax=Paracoccus seriniphilus TaxID=184748 RepID=A0A239PLB8_9RHOB|nr:MotA/TolQ/ExbB proton channel family protein [Paracoccus seriniphilus]WCR13785.1 MotA/TolQ/ExbB proton channel family protein [Paracoccus seriniphilus]SNT68601.1 outer membrane transport energization protein ExbB [Paracoccus seriniphilus]